MLSDKRTTTDITKFIAALLVVNGHTFMYYSGMPEVARWLNLGAQCVSLFLFFSAYGLMCAYEKKGDAYLQGFLPRRIGRILIPLVTAYVLSLAVYALFQGAIDWGDVLSTLYWGGPYLKFSWYVTEIAILYSLFYACARHNKSSKQLAMSLSVAVLLLVTLMFATRQPSWYLNGLPCFVLGIWYQRYEKQLIRIVEKHRSVLQIGLLLCFLVFFQWRFVRNASPVLSAYRYEYVAMYLSNLFFVSLIIICINSINRIQLTTRMGGAIYSFYEIYLVQNAVMIAVTSFDLPFVGHWLLIMVSSVVMGYVMYRINAKISSLIYKR